MHWSWINARESRLFRLWVDGRDLLARFALAGLPSLIAFRRTNLLGIGREWKDGKSKGGGFDINIYRSRK